MQHTLKRIIKSLLASLILLGLAMGIFCLFPADNRLTVSRTASHTPAFTVHRYEVNATVTEDRKVIIQEEIEVTINRVGSQEVFYKALPVEGDRYQNIWANGIGNPDFSYEVADNPDVEGFLDINCKGGVAVGARLTYQFGYTLLITGEDRADGMIVDFVGAGCPAPYNEVTVNVTFPASLSSYTIYSSAYGGEGNDYVSVNAQTDTSLSLYAVTLPLVYNDTFEEYCAAPITVDFTLSAGAFQPYFSTLWSSPALWVTIALAAIPLLAGGICFIAIRKRREIVTVVNLSAPDKMDPMEMGAVLDGVVDNEDVTSMIYYFAEQGYLSISFEDESNPTLIKLRPMPMNAPAHQKVLFDGLFAGNVERIDVDSLKYSYYDHIDKAKVLLSHKTDMKTRYESKSILAGLGCAILFVAVSVLLPLIVAKAFIHQTYTYVAVTNLLFHFFMTLIILVCSFGADNVKYKGKGKGAKVLTIISIVLTAAGVVVGTFIPSHVLSHLEKAVLYLCGYAGVWLGAKSLTRKQAHCEMLGDILGFKEFIVVTEEDKIKQMLEENPQAYYHILPYAQVLGVTDEWEKKFQNITLEPPAWCTGYTGSVYDYYIMTRMLRLLSLSMAARPSSGSHVGSSGGGGSFGGFSGGGHGGGGFGTR